LSPVLFCLYLDELLVALSKAGAGCYIGDIFVGALAYADDIVLIAPSATALRNMLHICYNCACKYSMSFNAQKSKCRTIVSPLIVLVFFFCDVCVFAFTFGYSNYELLFVLSRI